MYLTSIPQIIHNKLGMYLTSIPELIHNKQFMYLTSIPDITERNKASIMDLNACIFVYSKGYKI